MIAKVILSIVVAAVIGFLTMFVGYACLEASLEKIGGLLIGVAPVAGLLSGVWYFFAGPEPKHV